MTFQFSDTAKKVLDVIVKSPGCTSLTIAEQLRDDPSSIAAVLSTLIKNTALLRRERESAVMPFKYWIAKSAADATTTVGRRAPGLQRRSHKAQASRVGFLHLIQFGKNETAGPMTTADAEKIYWDLHRFFGDKK